MKSRLYCFLAFLAFSNLSFGQQVLQKEDTDFLIPVFNKSVNNTAILSWLEKTDDGTSSFYMSFVDINGQLQGKKLIYSNVGVSGSRLMKPEVLQKPDGTLVAVFSFRPVKVIKSRPVADHGKGKPKRNRPSDLKIMYSVSKNNGDSWSDPKTVHDNSGKQAIRGFFDSEVLPNGEVAVAWLNDLPGKQHERDLRMVTTNGDSFGEEVVIDPFTCDCCNISLLTDNKGMFHVFYRENINNTRDIYQKTSTDNGATFTEGKPVYKDNWQINGCPHSGPSSIAYGQGIPLVTWYSGAENDEGIRLANLDGKLFTKVGGKSGKLSTLCGSSGKAYFIWKQDDSNGVAKVYMSVLQKDTLGEPIEIEDSENVDYISSMTVNSKLLIVFEKKSGNEKKNISLKLF